MKDKLGKFGQISQDLELAHLRSRSFHELSGGELQRVAIALLCIQDAQIYMFDEPSSFLDVRQRLAAARVIRELMTVDRYIVVVEHDLSVLDYLSDFVCCLWGSAGAYGVVTMPFSVREGINIFLDGKIPTENLRFRQVSLTFKLSRPDDQIDQNDQLSQTKYPRLRKTISNNGFQLEVQAGHFCKSEIIVMLGQNGTGKTTFIRMLAGLLAPDSEEGDDDSLPQLNVSYKPQSITPKFEGTVSDLFLAKMGDAFSHPQFQADVAKPMLMDAVLHRSIQSLSGGELQRVALVLALGRPADIYLIDEPSAYLDAEQRIVAARVIKNFVLTTRSSAFIVEHDFIMATYLADRVVVYDGKPGISCTASQPLDLVVGMNRFLMQLGITVRRDQTNFRPRINKIDSIKDREQKESGHYFLLDS
jgi:ATP-binding cassette subfamily E protein 1